MKIKLKDYQEEAVKFALNNKHSLYCMKVGCGKTICALFSARALLKRKEIDKVIIACTATATNVFEKDLKEKAGVEVKLITKCDEFINFLNNKEKICLIKHSMFENLGNDLIYLKTMQNIKKEGIVCITDSLCCTNH